jgi:hypothetical protein
MLWLVPVAAAVVVGLIVAGSRPAAAAVPRPVGPGQWVDPDAPRRIRELADRIGWSGLSDFLVAVAYWESRGNSRAGSDEGNAARGWFGLRPKSARVEDLGLDGDALKDEALSVALAAWYAHRVMQPPYAVAGQAIDWLAVRRGWWLPKLVKDGYEAEPGSANVRLALEESFIKAGMDPMLMYEIADQFAWPGIDAVIAQVRGA